MSIENIRYALKVLVIISLTILFGFLCYYQKQFHYINLFIYVQIYNNDKEKTKLKKNKKPKNPKKRDSHLQHNRTETLIVLKSAYLKIQTVGKSVF